MSLFRDVAYYRPAMGATTRRDLFSGPSELTLHDGDRGYANIMRFFMGSAAIGRVVSTGHDVALAEHMAATLIVPFRGSLTVEAGQRTFSAGSGGALLFSPNTRRTRVSSPAETTFFGIPIILPTRELHAAADRIGVLAGLKAPTFDFAVEMDSFRGRSARELIQVVRLIVSEVERAAVRMQRPDAQVSWLELLSEKTVEVLAEADVVRMPGDLGSRPAYRHVRRAMEYMNEHFADVTTTADIARECGISVRALEQAFSTVLGDSPHSVLSAIRLDEARRILLARSGEVSVTEVALACGLSHPGRFAAAYRRRFGEHPSALTRGRS